MILLTLIVVCVCVCGGGGCKSLPVLVLQDCEMSTRGSTCLLDVLWPDLVCSQCEQVSWLLNWFSLPSDVGRKESSSAGRLLPSLIDHDCADQ
jgi:hypothetical protein